MIRVHMRVLNPDLPFMVQGPEVSSIVRNLRAQFPQALEIEGYSKSEMRALVSVMHGKTRRNLGKALAPSASPPVKKKKTTTKKKAKKKE
jgi:hypothetical protein